MDFELFSALLRNLLHINVQYTEEDDSDTVFSVFQDKYCYHEALQPSFTAGALAHLIGQMQENTIYDFQDDLGICLICFLFSGRRFLAGPFVRKEFDEEKIQSVLIAHGVPASYISSIRLYYSAFPVISPAYVRSTVVAFLRTFSGKNEEYAYYRLGSNDTEIVPRQPSRTESLDYSSLHHRYDLENNFLRMIETGDTENVIDTRRQLTMSGLSQNRYINAMYQDPGVGLSMLRALARKAAERGGAPLVEIHEITQRAMQRMYTAKNFEEQNRYSDDMILELTEAVHRSRMHLSGYSAPVRRVVEHIRLNYSQELTLSALSELAGLSESYLTKAFKKEVGSTIFQYIAHLRCLQAAEMLKSTDTSIQEISSYVGYEDNNYFVKVFKKQFGVTPSAYRAART